MSKPVDRGSRARPLPVKISRPSVAGLVARERLFLALDRGARGRLIWVTGPAGAGKTSLLSSWLDARRHRVLWYRADESDADPASFFSYLTRGAEVLSRRRQTPLPLLTPEYLPNPSGYVRRYSELLWEKLGAPLVLVLDNYQALPPDAPLQMMLAAFVEHLPAGCIVVAISREDAPTAFARWQADAGFSAIGWDALRLTDTEAAEIAHAHGASDTARSAQLNAFARGWSAGLVLLLRAVKVAIAVPQTGSGTPGVLADYFAAEIFERLAPEEQHFLMCTAIPTHIRAEIATALTGRADADALLADQYHRRFFIDQTSYEDGAVLYEYHPLFREFLLARAAQRFGAEALARLRSKTALMLEAVGKTEPALMLYEEAQDWPNTTRLICQLAPALMQQGRALTIAAWIVAVPLPAREAVPWLSFWLGVCRSLQDPRAGRALLADAFTRFTKADDTLGALLACSEILNTFIFMGDSFAPAAPWAEHYCRLLEPDPKAVLARLPDEAAIRVIGAGMLLGICGSSHPVLSALASLGGEYGSKSLSADLRMQALMFPAAYWSWTGDIRKARIAGADASAIALHATSPAPLIYWLLVHAQVCWLTGEEANALEALARAETLARQSGVIVLNTMLGVHRVYAALGAGDLDQADRVLHNLELDTAVEEEARLIYVRNVRAGYFLLSGNFERAREVLTRCIADHDASGVLFQAATCRIELGQVLMLEGRHADARVQLSLALQFARTMPTDLLAFHALMAEAYTWLAEGKEAERGMTCLREALDIGKRRDYLNCHPWWIPKVMSFLFSRALEAGIEPDYVRRFIRHRKVTPDTADVPGWPWPVRVYTLGAFRVLQDGEPQHAGRKTPRRVLELLQAIIALGANGMHSASRERLTEALWPDAEGDAARDAFEIALHRLRKLLHGENAIRLEGGLVTLDARHVWVDTQAFEQFADEIQREPDASAAGHSAFTHTVEKALKLYAGHFLADQIEQPWALPARERLRSKFERLIGHAGAHWEHTNALAQATNLYQRAIELDPLAEALYRHLMRVHAKAGRNAEALATYRRCKHMLSVVLSIAPSAETEALHATLAA
jgi:ATP/maltotriose-dependent transcriptional regulator MalT/DNA-binding SARP family transcriptional activator